MKRAIILLSWLAIWAFTWCAPTPLHAEQSTDETISPAEAAQLAQKQAPGIAIADTVVEPRIGKTVFRVQTEAERGERCPAHGCLRVEDIGK